MGALTHIGPSPLATQARTCVSGQPCAFGGVLGHWLRDQDTLWVLDTCGEQDASPQMVQGGRLTVTESSGSFVSWGSLVSTTSGGEYRLCWCASGFACSVAMHFRVDVGELTVIGPRPVSESQGALRRLVPWGDLPWGQDRTCVSGQTCAVDGLVGKFLSSEDGVAVLDTCGVASISPRSAMTARAFQSHDRPLESLAGDGTSFYFGSTPITVAGGIYRICWCAGGYQCSMSEDYRVDAGEFTVVGPRDPSNLYLQGTRQLRPAFHERRTCVSGQTCVVEGIRGLHLTDGDHMLVLETCGTLVQEGIFRQPTPLVQAEQSLTCQGSKTAECSYFGYATSFGSTFLSLPGGEYRLCWCAATFGCNTNEHFRVDVGGLTLIGPSSRPARSHWTRGHYS